MLKKAAVYARVSSKEQQQEGFSIPAQLKLLKEYALKNSIQIVREFTDAETAKSSGREQFGEMVKYINQHQVKVILVEKTDRLYRNFRDYVTVGDIEDLEVHLVKEGEVLSKDSKSHQKFIHGIKVLMAKNYIDNLSEEVTKGLFEKAARGQYPGQAPTGYLNITTATKERIMAIDPERAPLVKRLFELYATHTQTLDMLHTWSHDNGLWSKYGKPLSRANIEKILKNPVYYGDFFYSGRLYRGTHEPIVHKQLWDEVQRAFKRHCHVNGRLKRNFLFTGFLTCAVCGCAVVAEIKKKKYVYYHCSKFKKECQSKAVYVREEELAKQFEEIVKSIRVPAETIDSIVMALKESCEDKNRFRDEAKANLRSRVDAIQSRINQAYLDKLDGKITEEFWLSKTNEWQEELATLQCQLNAYENVDMPYYESGRKLLELAKHAYQLYLRGTVEEKRKILQLVQSNSKLNNGKLEYHLRKPFNWMAEWASNPVLFGGVDSNHDSQSQSLKAYR